MFFFDISQSNTSHGGHSENQCECDCGGFAKPGLKKNGRGGVLTYNNPKSCVGIPGLVHCLGNGMKMSLTAHNKDVMGFIMGSVAIAFLFGVVTHWRYTKGFTKRKKVFRILRKK